MNHRSRSLALLVAIAAPLLAPIRPANGANLHFNGELAGRDGSRADDQDLEQRYDLYFSHVSTLTPILELQGAIRYSRTVRDAQTNQLVTPSLRASLVNPYFTLDLQGTASRSIQETAPDITTRTWEASWRSRWSTGLLPAIRLYAGQTFTEDDGEPQTTDTKNTHAGASADWHTGIGSFSANFNTDKNTNSISRSKSTSDTVLGRYATNVVFFDRRLQMSFSQQISHTKSHNEAPVLSGGYAQLPVPLRQGLAGDDPTPSSGTLPAVPGLVDGDRNTGTVTIDPPPVRTNIAVQHDFRPLDVIVLTTETDISALVGQLAFDIYTSDDGSIWTRKRTGVPATYDADKRELTVETGRRDSGYTKLVATSTPTTPVSITEVTAYRRIAATGDLVTIENETETSTSTLGVDAVLRPDLTLHYNISYQKSRYTDAADFWRANTSGSLNWQAADDLAIDLTSNATLQHRDGQAETLNRSYGISTSARPLPTLDLTAGLTFSESYTGSRRQTKGVLYFTTVGAQLYRDLDGRLNYTRSEVKDLVADSTSRTDNADLIFTARLFPSLLGDLRFGYQGTSGGDGSTSATDVTLLLNWRPSAIFGLRASIGQTWAASDTTTAGLGFDLAMTQKTQFSASWDMSRSTITTQTVHATWRWTIDEHLSFHCDGQYRDAQETTWQILARLLASYQIL